MADQLYEESAVLKQITEFYDQQISERNHQLCKVNIEMKRLQPWKYKLGVMNGPLKFLTARKI